MSKKTEKQLREEARVLIVKNSLSAKSKLLDLSDYINQNFLREIYDGSDDYKMERPVTAKDIFYIKKEINDCFFLLNSLKSKIEYLAN